MTIHTSHTEPPILQLQDISFSYHTLEGETPVLHQVSFEIQQGEFISVIGPSGAGKSTLLNLLAGLIPVEEGKILFLGKDLYLQKKEGLSFPLGYMLQQDQLFEFRTIWQNVILGLEINKKLTSDNISYVNSLLKKYNLYEFKDKKPSQLSGGMRQRAALIRTLALRPKILLLDEPFSALDYQTRLEVSGDIAKIIKENNITAILVTHNLSEAIGLSDRVLVLSPRPATIIKQLPIHLTLPSDNLLSYRLAPEFNTYFNELWEDLNHEKQK